MWIPALSRSVLFSQTTTLAKEYKGIQATGDFMPGYKSPSRSYIHRSLPSNCTSHHSLPQQIISKFSTKLKIKRERKNVELRF